MQEEKIKEYIFQAVQAGKKETSGLVSDVLEKMESNIGKSIEKHINGQLRDIKKTLEVQNETLDEIKEEQIRVKEEVVKLKSDTDPIVDVKKSLTTMGKMILWLGGIAAAILGVLKLIYR